jgi:hypothetical protein
LAHADVADGPLAQGAAYNYGNDNNDIEYLITEDEAEDEESNTDDNEPQDETDELQGANDENQGAHGAPNENDANDENQGAHGAPNENDLFLEGQNQERAVDGANKERLETKTKERQATAHTTFAIGAQNPERFATAMDDPHSTKSYYPPQQFTQHGFCLPSNRMEETKRFAMNYIMTQMSAKSRPTKSTGRLPRPH